MNREADAGWLGRLRGWMSAALGRRATAAPSGLEALLAECRDGHGGEITVRERAARFAGAYRVAGREERAAILALIGREIVPDARALDAALDAMSAGDLRAEAALRKALDAPRAKFFAQFNLLPEGVKFLVDLRADLLAFLEREPALEVLRVELDQLLEIWFDPGFLELRRITWQSPALVLEKLIAYEAVHRIESWDDLKNRLDRDRRCYAFFHPRMPNEPLIFVEIALSKGLPESVQLLLDAGAPAGEARDADTAVFYSISNAQKGLRGISLGNLLLKRVIADLQQDLPGLKAFATLSPIPGFRKWLERTAPDESERERLEKLCARYLVQERTDPVAQFHLANGARLDGIFWGADASERGQAQSLGMMASYRYDPGEVDRNHDEFLRTGRVIASKRVLRLL